MQQGCKANYQSVLVNNVLPKISWGEQSLSDVSTENTYLYLRLAARLTLQHPLRHTGFHLHSSFHRLSTKACTVYCTVCSRLLIMCCSHSLGK